jgi:molecular chaperone DnaK (HSP70)
MAGDERREERSRYLVGIDLGTTNSAVAYIDTRRRAGGGVQVQNFAVSQLVAEGDTQARQTLPSFLYLPGAHELPTGATRLPWDEDRETAVGEFARRQGARVPARLVTSAKSWLCHGGVDRTARILPWGDASDEVTRVSPVEASAQYLQHMREAWNHTIARDDESSRLEQQDVVLTVPASFDEVSRELTLDAARRAGLPRVTMLEEPQAAFYAWIVAHESSWILVCDIGGGTTDFTLIVVDEGRAGLRFERVAVGEHLLLGGDNMDLALARRVEERLTGKVGKLEPQAWAGLVHAARLAKEDLLDDRSDAPETVPITLLGQSSSVVAGLMRDQLARSEVEEVLLSGFFPVVPPESEPERRQVGMTEFGLPYVADPAATRHLGAFLRRHRDTIGDAGGTTAVGMARPDAILFSGAALIPASLRERLREAVAAWFQTEDAGYNPELLTSPSLQQAVARGAAYYGHVRRGKGVRIHGGSARGYYVGVDVGATAEDEERLSVVCMVRRGTEEGSTVELDRPFEAHVNRPVSFQLYSSSVRTDRNGDLVVVEPDALVPLPPIRTLLRFGKKTGERRLPVKIGARLTEVGTLDLYCFSRETDHRWRLEFQVRDAAQGAAPPADESGDGGAAEPGAAIDRGVTIEESTVEELERVIRGGFEPGGPAEITPASIMRFLRSGLDLDKEEWPLPIIRKLAELLLSVRESRRRSAAHDARWLNLIGFCLRPGFGYPMDDWRIKELWKIWAGPAKRSKEGKRLGKQEQVEMWRCAASLEAVERARKVAFGQALVDRVQRAPTVADLWALGRLGARVPFHGPANQAASRKAVEGWIRRLLKSEWKLPEATAQALALLARRTGDRERDIDEGLRGEIAERLAEAGPAFARARTLVLEGGELEREEESQTFGESLPAGLVLVDAES